MTVINPLKALSDDEIVAKHTVEGANSHFVSEMIRRHKDASDKIARRIFWLNVLIALLTAALVWLAIIELRDKAAKAPEVSKEPGGNSSAVREPLTTPTKPAK
jgi:hypothetical protein